ncbi:hypothetical protein AU467_25355 [Mesorhizobium loti]|uniref:Uncharacterized protein n=1 Tax=Rhizobium loti TaxID=381 RepID=A0A101KRC8_RHILI|nr:hypothetical protein AU467_25355 [Mesorhizobium loti]
MIDFIEEAADNIRVLHAYLSSRPERFDNSWRSAWNKSLRSVKRWYATWDPQKGWMVGFSKFIGYKDMTGERYTRYLKGNPNHEALSGRRTESQRGVLRQNATEIDVSNPVWPELSDALSRFLVSQGREGPRVGATIRILRGYERPPNG